MKTVLSNNDVVFMKTSDLKIGQTAIIRNDFRFNDNVVICDHSMGEGRAIINLTSNIKLYSNYDCILADF